MGSQITEILFALRCTLFRVLKRHWPDDGQLTETYCHNKMK